MIVWANIAAKTGVNIVLETRHGWGHFTSITSRIYFIAFHVRDCINWKKGRKKICPELSCDSPAKRKPPQDGVTHI